MAHLEGVAVAVPADCRGIDPGLLEGLDRARPAVLFVAGWSRHWRTSRYFDGNPYLTRAAAGCLAAAGAALVGIDSLNIDDTRDGERPVHSVLLAARISIVEHLTVAPLEERPERQH